jgi:pseudouridine-5'-phosphate glycosidase
MLKVSPEVESALDDDKPIVALESTVISHGLPRPINLETARRIEDAVRVAGAVPATIAVLQGEFRVGLSDDELRHLAESENIRKISRRDLPIASAMGLDCATTVSTTSYLAHAMGIEVFATGGIGGVHRGFSADVSADLPELARTPITVVCAGAKIILDLAATREWLETNGVTVLGWKCDEMPAFYSRESGLRVDQRVDSAEQAREIILARDELGLPNSILVTAPIPEEFEIDRETMERAIDQAMKKAFSAGISGKETTPFLLSEVSRITEGRSVTANIALLENNARIAAEIAVSLFS